MSDATQPTGPRAIGRAVVVVLFVGLSALVWRYLYVLVRRTDFLAHDISIANDSIHIMYLACGALLLVAAYAALRRVVRPALGYAMLLAAATPTAAFTWLNQSDVVCMSKKAGQCISLFDKDYALVSLLYDAAKGLGFQ